MLEWTEILIRLSLAAVFGAVIGMERERKNWAAGMRTHMLVCVGSTLTMIVSSFGFGDILGTPNVSLDPSRVAAQVISGIGFIGAGTILFLRQGIVRGLTTAAGLWTVAAIGLATGGGMYFAAFVTTALVFIILLILKPLERRLAGRFRPKSLKIITANAGTSLEVVKRVFSDDKLNISSYVVNKSEDEDVILFTFTNANQKYLGDLVSNLQTDPEIKEVIWNK